MSFGSGRRRRDFEAPPGTYERMRRSFSKGAFFEAHIRDRLRFAAAERDPD